MLHAPLCILWEFLVAMTTVRYACISWYSVYGCVRVKSPLKLRAFSSSSLIYISKSNTYGVQYVLLSVLMYFTSVNEFEPLPGPSCDKTTQEWSLHSNWLIDIDMHVHTHTHTHTSCSNENDLLVSATEQWQSATWPHFWGCYMLSCWHRFVWAGIVLSL